MPLSAVRRPASFASAEEVSLVRPTTRRRGVRAFVASIALILALPASTLGVQRHPNPEVAYVALTSAVTAAGGRVVPLINSGQTYDGVTFEGIPDGLGAVPVGRGDRYVDLYVAFEQSHVPFGGFADFEDSSVQRARLDLRTMQLTKLDEVLPPSAGFIRFCSAFMAGPAEGFANYTFFVNEESNDVIDVPMGAPYGADPALSPYRQAGYAVYLDTKTGDYDEISTAGRHNHENTVIVPGGWDGIVALSGDDTFDAPSSQLYLSLADDAASFTADESDLYAFQVTSANGVVLSDPYDAFNGANDYHEIEVGDTFGGRFIPVPEAVARGTTGVAPQRALEEWSNANNVFQFIRVEDLAYDPDDPTVVYFADTGERRALTDDVWVTLDDRDGSVDRSATGRLHRGLSRVPADPAQAEIYPADPAGQHANGRIFRMALNPNDPLVVDAFTVVHDADTTLADGVQRMRNPDNLDVGRSSIMVQEDASNAKIWRYSLSSGQWSQVGTVTHPTAPASGESSGIIDMSRWLGTGWWALDVQSHVNLPGTVGPLTYTVPITGAQITYNARREDGQLLLIHVPGS
jgi:hypothetical protein